MMVRNLICVSVGLCCSVGHKVFAQSPELIDQSASKTLDLSLDLTLGAEIDSNVTVADIDLASGLDDLAFILKGRLGFDHRPSQDSRLRGHLSLTQKNYDKFSQFDQTLLFSSLDLSQKLNKSRIGISGRYIHAVLDGSEYLEAFQVSPYISHYFGRKNFGRAYYTWTDKSYKFRPERDGDTQALGVDLYHFFNGTRRFISAGYKYESVKATELQLAYDSHRVKAKFQQKIPIGQRDTTLALYGRYEARKYDDLNFAIFDIREDDRWTFGSSLELPLGNDFKSILDISLKNFNSNLLLVDYDKTVVSLHLTKSF